MSLFFQICLLSMLVDKLLFISSWRFQLVPAQKDAFKQSWRHLFQTPFNRVLNGNPWISRHCSVSRHDSCRAKNHETKIYNHIKDKVHFVDRILLNSILRHFSQVSFPLTYCWKWAVINFLWQNSQVWTAFQTFLWKTELLNWDQYFGIPDLL